MQATLPASRGLDRDLTDSIPLYVASLVITLAGVGAVGVTLPTTAWTPIWVMLALVGHLCSFAIRWARIPVEYVFYPVMILAGLACMFQYTGRNVLPGMDGSPNTLDIGMATALVVATLGVARTFAMVTNGALLFSPVPAITMLALVGSTNPNAEVPVFFGLLLLGSLFIVGYEAHLRRSVRAGREAGSVLPYLLTCWALALVVVTAALVFPVVLQPVLGQFSPFLRSMTQFRNLSNITQVNTNQARVGAGPIQLSPAPVFEVYAPEGGRLRTTTFTRYTGKEWRTELTPLNWNISPDGAVDVQPDRGDASYQQRLWDFDLGPDPELTKRVPTRQVTQKIVTVGASSYGIPGFARITRLRYPGQNVTQYASGVAFGRDHTESGRYFEVDSQIAEPSPEQLRAATAIDPTNFKEPEALELPVGTQRVKELAQRITRGQTNAYDKIQTILDYIERNCQYSLLEDVTPAGSDAADHYLFVSKRGACDLAATASVVMCRALGIPARVAVGYVADEPLPEGNGFMVRQQHAHMWFEAYFEGYGWIAYDAAPPIAEIKEHPFTVLMHHVTGIFSKIGGGGLDALLVVILVFATVLMLLHRGILTVRAWWRRRREGEGPDLGEAGRIAACYAAATAQLQRKGWSRSASQTPREYLETLRREWAGQDDRIQALEALTNLMEAGVYGSTATPAGVEEARVAAARLAAVPAKPRPRRRARAVPQPEGA